MAPYIPGEMRPEWLIPSGVFVVTLQSGERVNGYAAGWVVRVSEVPVIVQVAVWEENYSYELAQDARHFVVHILEEGQQDVARHFGQTCGRETDKLCGYETHPGVSGVPVLEDCLTMIILRSCIAGTERARGSITAIFGCSLSSSYGARDTYK